MESGGGEELCEFVGGDVLLCWCVLRFEVTQGRCVRYSLKARAPIVCAWLQR